MHRAFTPLLLVAFVAALLVPGTHADVYLHSPRGQNDRCDEMSNDRFNDRRCYNSQNNAAGGYATCDKEMIFYPGTELSVEWYSQHSCGNGAKMKNNPANPESVQCQHIIQLGCDFGFEQYSDSDKTYALTDGVSLGRPGADQYNVVKNPTDVFNTFGNTCTQNKRVP